MTVQRAVIINNQAALATDFGLKIATEKFGAELIAEFPKITRGKNKGKPRGYIAWKKCTVGGWSHEGGRGHVQRPGSSNWRLTFSPYSQYDQGIVARWTWQAGAEPLVEVLQTPAEAEAVFKAVGDNPRYR